MRGMNRRPEILDFGADGVPRMRGDEQLTTINFDDANTRSPHARG